MATDIDYLGYAPLFIGVESQYWSLAQFQTAATNAKAMGFTSLLIKVGDGGIFWYQGIGGWQKVLSTVAATGIKAVPYCYCYGNTYNALTNEIALLTLIMHQVGIVVADMEVEYNGQSEWASQVCTALKPITGTLGICTWADPNMQNWQAVMAALAPATNFWMPQVYSDYLASVYKAQYAGYGPIYPILYLGNDFGANDIIATATAAQSPIIGFWEYQGLSSFASAVKSAMAATIQPPQESKPVITTPTQHQLDNAAAEWNATMHLFPSNVPPSYTTGIAGAWKARVCKGQHLGPPVSQEYNSVDWNGTSIKAQEFTGAHAEWSNGACRFFNGNGEIL